MFERHELSAVFTLHLLARSCDHSTSHDRDSIASNIMRADAQILPQLRCACCVYEKLAVNPRFDFLKKMSVLLWRKPKRRVPKSPQATRRFFEEWQGNRNAVYHRG